MINGAGVDK